MISNIFVKNVFISSNVYENVYKENKTSFFSLEKVVRYWDLNSDQSDHIIVINLGLSWFDNYLGTGKEA